MIDYWNRNNSRHSYTKEILENYIGLNNIVLSAITKMELILGAQNKNELVAINNNADKFNIASIDNNITNLAITFLQDYKLSHGLALPDAFIAATAQISGWELFTYNVKDYKFIKGLTLFDLQLS